jgi:hypothetical protein
MLVDKPTVAPAYTEVVVAVELELLVPMVLPVQVEMAVLE